MHNYITISREYPSSISLGTLNLRVKGLSPLLGTSYHMDSLNLLILNVPKNERSTINDWTYKFMITALHNIQSWDMITEKIESIEIWESLSFETQELRAKSPVT